MAPRCWMIEELCSRACTFLPLPAAPPQLLLKAQLQELSNWAITWHQGADKTSSLGSALAWKVLAAGEDVTVGFIY